jgi:hypothetical protein
MLNKSWKTTLAGLLLAIGQFLVALEDPYLKLAGQVASAIGAFLLGAVAKDHDVTGGTKTT